MFIGAWFEWENSGTFAILFLWIISGKRIWFKISFIYRRRVGFGWFWLEKLLVGLNNIPVSSFTSRFFLKKFCNI